MMKSFVRYGQGNGLILNGVNNLDAFIINIR